MIAHVGVGVAEGAQQRGRGAHVALLSEGERRLHAQVRVVVVQELDERRERVHVAHREHLQRAVEEAEVVMVLAHRGQERGDGVRRGAARQPLDGHAPDAPALVPERGEEGPRGFERLVTREGLRGAESFVLVGVGELFGEAALAFDPRRHVFDRDEHADRPVVLAQGRDGHALLHPVEMLRGARRGAGDEVVVERRREDFHDPFVQHPPEACEQPALFQVGEQLGQRLPAGRVRGDARQAREGRVPDSNDETRVGGKNADWIF